MQRALDLAILGREWVSPNPMVGCVIVKNDLVIGEGFHQKYGKAHAEVNAVNSVEDKADIVGSDVYVTLEPCSHFGKTPPCADLLIKYQPKNVYICNTDPNPKVAGTGIERLKATGINVETGILEKKGLEINERFFKVMETGLPYIIIKWAETADKFVSNKDKTPLKITGELTDMNVHKWRSEEDAIMVGSGTIKSDNPRLNNRLWPINKSPKRVVIDKNLQLNGDFNILKEGEKTFIINVLEEKQIENIYYIKIPENDFFLENSLRKLVNVGINSVLIEGGPTLINKFFELGLYDEIRVLKSKKIIKEGIHAPNIPSGIPLLFTSTFLEDIYYNYKK